MNSGALVIRADANKSIGTGHVMRCLALAQVWQDKAGLAVFASAKFPSGLESRFVSDGCSVVSLAVSAGTQAGAESTIEIARNRGAEWVVVDGDHFDSDFLRSLQAARLRVLLIDDFARRESFPVDLIVNPNLGAREELYRRRAAGATLCLGQSFVLLRREFTAWRGRPVFSEKGNKVLVTLGGSDPDGLTLKIVRALAEGQDYEIIAIAGPAYASWNELQPLASDRVRVLLDPLNMREVMEEADMAVIAAGGTLWELLYMACPVLSYARNPFQAHILATLAKMGILVDMGDAASLNFPVLAAKVEELANSASLREQMANAGRRLIDGKGAQRVVETMMSLAAGR